MARPLSSQKRENLLNATTHLVATEGPSVATARIVQAAGESVGTLFRYFESKEELLNQLFLTLKDELHIAMVKDYRETSSRRQNARQMWNAYVSWGVHFPDKRNTLLQLDVCDLVTAENKQRGRTQFTDVLQVIYGKAGREANMASFAAGIFASLGTAAIASMIEDPERAEMYLDLGFNTFWSALAKIDGVSAT